jgi:hypothetical protein
MFRIAAAHASRAAWSNVNMADVNQKMRRLGWRAIREAHRHDPSDAELAQFQEQIGGPLPADYLQFLRRYGQAGFDNGARFPIPQPSPFGARGTLDRVYGFSDEEGQSVVDKTMMVYAGRIPDQTIPIGEDPGGNLILLGFADPVKNQIWFWNHHDELAGQVEEMRDELEDAGIDTLDMDDDGVTREWIARHPHDERLPTSFYGMSKLADSFDEFIDALDPHPDYDSG